MLPARYDDDDDDDDFKLRTPENLNKNWVYL